MSASPKKYSKDGSIIGDVVASQPLSGTKIVQGGQVKGFTNMAFSRSDDAAKKAS